MGSFRSQSENRQLILRMTIFNSLLIIGYYVVAGVFCFPSLILMLYYDLLLGVICLLILIVVLGIFAVVAVLMVHRHVRILAAEGELNGDLVQFFNGISKIRTTGAENAAFAHWADRFSTKKQIYRSFANCRSFAIVVNAVIPVLTIGTVISTP